MRFLKHWNYQELLLTWSLWSFGFMFHDAGGWEYDTLTLCFGPCSWTFLSDRQMGGQ